MEIAVLSVRFLGIISLVAILGFIVCFLAVLGYNTYIKAESKNKKIEVQTTNSNSNSN